MATPASMAFTLSAAVTLLAGMFYVFPVAKRLPFFVHGALLVTPLVLAPMALLLRAVVSENGLQMVLAGILVVVAPSLALFGVVRALSSPRILIATSNISEEAATPVIPDLDVFRMERAIRTLWLPGFSLRRRDGAKPSVEDVRAFHAAMPRLPGAVEWRFVLWTCAWAAALSWAGQNLA